MDIACRKLLRQIVGPPGGIDWTRPWHDILHDWHERVYDKLEDTQDKLWSYVLYRQYWSFAGYVANTPADRWLSRVLNWSPPGNKSQGRPRKTWESEAQSVCNEFEIGTWTLAGKDARAWERMAEDVLDYVSA